LYLKRGGEIYNLVSVITNNATMVSPQTRLNITTYSFKILYQTQPQDSRRIFEKYYCLLKQDVKLLGKEAFPDYRRRHPNSPKVGDIP